MLGPAPTPTGASMLYSPTPMKRRSSKKGKSPKRRSKEIKDGKTMPKISFNKKVDSKDFDDCSKKSNQDSLSSKLGSTVAMEESESDSDCDNRSFFSEAFSTISELPEPPETASPNRPGSPKKRDKARKKKKKKTDKADKTEKRKKKKDKPDKVKDSPGKSRKKREKSGKSKKKRDKPGKSPTQSGTEQNSKKASPSKRDQKANESSDDDSFLGEAFDGAHRVVPRIQQHQEEEETAQDFPGGPPLWGDSDEEKSYGSKWEEDQSWNGWEGENDDKSEYVEETLCDESNDGFSYYTIQSNDDLEDLGFPEDADIEDDEMSECDEKDEDARGSSRKSVRFNECETVHDTLHISDFTKKEIRRSWYQQKDYEETIQGVKEVACSSQTPRDTQTRLLRQRSLSSKNAETRGLEAWTPSGVQRFRYVKEAAFRAVWDEQQKQLDRADFEGYQEGEDDDISAVFENQESLRQAYERVSKKSLNEAQMRAKEDEEIAAKLQTRLKKRHVGRRGSWEKSMGSSARRLLDGSSHGLSDNPAAPPSCLRKQEDPAINEGLSKSEHKRRVSFGESARGLARQLSDLGLATRKPERRSFSKQGSDRSLFKKNPERGVFRQSSDRSLFKKNPERGLFRQMSDRGLFNKDKGPERGLFRQSSDRSLFKKKSGLGLFSNASDHNRSLFTQKTEFDPIAEESDTKRKPTRRSSDMGLRLFKEKPDHGSGPRRNSITV